MGRATEGATVEAYRLVASTGRPVRVATLVRLADGSVIRFTERMGRREALRNAELQLQLAARRSGEAGG